MPPRNASSKKGKRPQPFLQPSGEASAAAEQALAAFSALRASQSTGNVGMGASAASGSTSGKKSEGRGGTVSSPDIAVSISDSEVDPAVAAAMRSLWKKDSMTKLKALRTLEELLEPRVAEEIPAVRAENTAWVLPALEPWSRCYGRIVFDADRRVRLAAHTTNSQFATLAGRDVAPFLKFLLGPWICGTCDPARDVGIKAAEALSRVFSKAGDVLDENLVNNRRITSAIWFVRNPLCEYFSDNFSKSVTNLIENKIVDAERADEIRDMLRSMSLKGLAFVAQSLEHSAHALPGEPRIFEFFLEHDLLSGPFFRNMVDRKTNAAIVRNAAYECLTVVCQLFSAAVVADLDGKKNVFRTICLFLAPMEEAHVLAAAFECTLAFAFAARNANLSIDVRNQMVTCIAKTMVPAAFADGTSQTLCAVPVCSGLLPLCSCLFAASTLPDWASTIPRHATLLIDSLWLPIAFTLGLAPRPIGLRKLTGHVLLAAISAFCDLTLFFAHKAIELGETSGTLNSAIAEHLDAIWLVTENCADFEREAIVNVVGAAIAKHDSSSHSCEATIKVFDNLSVRTISLVNACESLSGNVILNLSQIAGTFSCKLATPISFARLCNLSRTILQQEHFSSRTILQQEHFSPTVCQVLFALLEGPTVWDVLELDLPVEDRTVRSIYDSFESNFTELLSSFDRIGDVAVRLILRVFIQLAHHTSLDSVEHARFAALYDAFLAKLGNTGTVATVQQLCSAIGSAMSESNLYDSRLALAFAARGTELESSFIAILEQSSSEKTFPDLQTLLEPSGRKLHFLFPNAQDVFHAISSALAQRLAVADLLAGQVHDREQLIDSSILVLSIACDGAWTRAHDVLVDLSAHLVLASQHSDNREAGIAAVRRYILLDANFTRVIPSFARLITTVVALLRDKKSAADIGFALGGSLRRVLPDAVPVFKIIQLIDASAAEYLDVLFALKVVVAPQSSGAPLTILPLADRQQQGVVNLAACHGWITRQSIIAGLCAGELDTLVNASFDSSSLVDAALLAGLQSQSVVSTDPDLGRSFGAMLVLWKGSSFAFAFSEAQFDAAFSSLVNCLPASDAAAVVLGEVIGRSCAVSARIIAAAFVKAIGDPAHLLDVNLFRSLFTGSAEVRKDSSLRSILKKTTMDAQQRIESFLRSNENATGSDIQCKDMLMGISLVEVLTYDSQQDGIRAFATLFERIGRWTTSSVFVNDSQVALFIRLISESYFGLKRLLVRMDASVQRASDSFVDFPRVFEKAFRLLLREHFAMDCFALHGSEGMLSDLLLAWNGVSDSHVARILDTTWDLALHARDSDHFLNCHVEGLRGLLAQPASRSLSNTNRFIRLLEPNPTVLSERSSSGALLLAWAGAWHLSNTSVSVTALTNAISELSKACSSEPLFLDSARLIACWLVAFERAVLLDAHFVSFLRDSPEEDTAESRPRVSTFLDTVLSQVDFGRLIRRDSADDAEIMQEFATLSSCMSWSLGGLVRIASNIVALDDDDDGTVDAAMHFILERAALLAFVKCLRVAPLQCRLWFADCVRNRQTATDIRTFVERFVSPTLVFDELNTVAAAAADAQVLKDAQAQMSGKTGDAPASDAEFSLTVSRAVGTGAGVTARYRVEDADLSFTLELPPCFPLDAVPAPISAVGTGVPSGRWRAWMLGVSVMLATNDASLLEAVLRWKVSMDRHFSGVEVCPICYSLFHISDRSLPTLPCRTCKNKFHSACMYKWVRVSRNNTCPMCRTPFG